MMESRKVQKAYEGMTEERKRLYRGLSAYHRELFRYTIENPEDMDAKTLQQEVEAWLDENIGGGGSAMDITYTKEDYITTTAPPMRKWRTAKHLLRRNRRSPNYPVMQSPSMYATL